MLVGVYSMGGLAHHDGSEETSGHDVALAFQPAVRGVKTRGGKLDNQSRMMGCPHKNDERTYIYGVDLLGRLVFTCTACL
jgi:hypothetical protein